ncbi:hypothetical protein Tco_1290812 [Tanacetum coccineum]
MLDYGFNFMNTKIYIDNGSTKCIVKNLVFHSKTNHIEIRHHFIRDAYEKKLIQVLKIHTDDNVADLLTKAFDVSRLRATYGAELVSAANLLNTARPTLSAARLMNLEFVDQHNMVACLEKTEGNFDFHEIVDFLASSSIHHALTVSPPIYTSYIEQFWNTANSQTVNDVKQINATVDSKAVVVIEASIRSSLLFNDVDGTACLTNEAIFQNLALMGYEGDQPPKTSSSHATTQDSRDSLEGTNGNEGDQELSVLCTNLSNRVLALESIKDAQAAELSALKSRIKKLEKKCKPSISHHRAWLKSVSMKKRFGKKESVSKQRRKKSKPESTLDDNTVFDDQDADHGMEYIETEEVVDEGRQSGGTEEVKLTDDTEVVEDKGSGDKGGNAEELVSTARPDIDAARQEDSAVEPRTPPKTTSIFDDEDITMAQTLIKMKEEKAKEKGVSIKDVEDSSRPARSILTLKPLPTIDPKDKGKKIARQLQEDLQAEVERERQREEEASKAAIAEMYDEVQAGIDTDALAAQRSAEIRSRPPTKSQLRNLMMTYLKNMGGYKHSQLKAKSFEEIKGMYERQKKSVQDFVPIGSAKEEELIKKMNEKATDEDTSNKEKVLEEPDSTKVEVKQEGHEDSTRKRPGRRLKMKATKKSKRQKTDVDLEEEEQLKAFLKIVPDEEGIIDYEVLEKRFPIINWESKFYDFDRHGAECIYYRIFRSDGSSRWIKTFSEMVTRFDRLDLVELYNLVMKRFETTTLEGVDLVL